MFAYSLAPVQRVWRLQRGGPYAFLNPILGAALLGAALSGPAWANPDQPADWREANELVGAFPRGHADIVQWEAQQRPPALVATPHGAAAHPHPHPHPQHASATPPAAAAQRWSLTDALTAARLARPDLLARPDQNALERAELRLAQAELALQVERAWLRAVAAGSSARYQAQVLQAAQAGAELAARMVRVGNWPQMNLLQEQLLLNQAQAQQRAAQHQQHLAVLDLWRLAGSGLTPAQLAQRLPTDWPSASATAPAADASHPHAAAAASPARPGAPATPATPSFAPLATLEAQALQAHPRWPLLQRQADMLERGLSPAEREGLAATLAAAVAPQPGTPAQPVQPELSPHQLWPHTWDKAAEARAEADALGRQIRADLHSA